MCRYLENPQLNSLRQFFFSIGSCLAFICISLHICLSSLCLQKERSKEEPPKVSPALGLQRSWLYPYSAYLVSGHTVSIAGQKMSQILISWLKEPEDLWSTALYFKSCCNSNVNWNYLSFESCGLKSTYLVIQYAKGYIHLGTKHLKGTWFLFLTLLIKKMLNDLTFYFSVYSNDLYWWWK